MDTAHGLHAYIKRACRCELCRAAWANYMRRYRKRRGLAKPTPYAGEHIPQTIRLTRLGLGIAAAAAQRQGVSIGDVVEAALRQVGPQIGVSALAESTL